MDDLAGNALREISYAFDAPPGPGEALEVAEGVLWLRIPLPMRPDHINIYALDDGDGWTIVDTGLNTGRVRAAWDKLLAGPLAGRPIRRVIVTHHHPDHVGNAGWFQTDHGAELWATRTTWLFSRMLMLDEQPAPPEELIAFWRRAGMSEEILAERIETRPMNFADVLAPMPLGFRRIAQDDVVVAGGRRWRVEIGHGHAPEHAMLWCLDEPLVIAGDQVLPTITSNLGTYATEPEADPVGEWVATCERLLPMARADQIVMPGHQRPFRGLDVRLQELIDHETENAEKLLAALRTPRSACDCFDVLYGRRIGKSEYGLALVEAVAHMNHLHGRGLVSREMSPEGVWLFCATGGDVSGT
ncbi:MBL fold metallo-hydrolase [Amaricoccus macauensis]|uniref:MBL fold metallo-hydrolase n=1 Tax=Amaricoccus macauensis TaxID=57001 RepID=UPI003C7E2040